MTVLGCQKESLTIPSMTQKPAVKGGSSILPIGP